MNPFKIVWGFGIYVEREPVGRRMRAGRWAVLSLINVAKDVGLTRDLFHVTACLVQMPLSGQFSRR